MKRLLTLLCLVVLIGLTPVYKNFKGQQLCLKLKNDQFNDEIASRLAEYSGVDGKAVYDYCAKLGVTEMTTEKFPY